MELKGTADAFNAVAPPEPSIDSRLEELSERYAHLKDDSFENSLGGNELSNQQSELKELDLNNGPSF